MKPLSVNIPKPKVRIKVPKPTVPKLELPKTALGGIRKSKRWF